MKALLASIRKLVYISILNVTHLLKERLARKKAQNVKLLAFLYYICYIIPIVCNNSAIDFLVYNVELSLFLIVSKS